jgi:arylsulfatase A-like enzyme
MKKLPPETHDPNDPDRRRVLRLLGRGASAVGLSSLLPLAAAPGCGPKSSNATQPNFVIIMTDDQGYGDLGCYGAPLIATPRIDRMAAEGVRLTDFYTAPVCAAARVGLMTGSHAERAGNLKRTGVGTRVGIHDDEVTIAELLRAQGYRTHLVGKWHLGMHAPFHPLRHGFDDFFGFLTSNGQNPPLMRGHDVVDENPDQSELIDLYTREALAHLERDRGHPFFLFISHAMPHVPLSAPERFRGQSEGGLYGDIVEALDWSCGRVFDTLREVGLDENTLVVFCSDNGPWTIKGDAAGSTGPLRGGKGQVFDGGIRVPCIARWPGHLPAGVTADGVASVMDWLPTFAGLANAAVPDDRVLDGRDLWPMLSGAPSALSPHEALFFFKGPDLAAVRSDAWKLHLARLPHHAEPTLFDIRRDLGERRNVASANPEVVRRLAALADAFRADLEANSRPAGTLIGATEAAPS